MSADLHVHTLLSDGTTSPLDLVGLAAKKGISCLAITDHDTIEGFFTAQEAGRDSGVEIIPGIELTAGYEGREVHILGYCFDPANRYLLSALSELRENRRGRVYNMVEKLNGIGIELNAQEVFDVSGGSVVGRMHIARAMYNKGLVSSIREAFERFIGDNSPSYICGFRLSPEKAVKLIRDSGGVPVLAHPYSLRNAEVLTRKLVPEGLMGLEVYYPEHTAQMRRNYLILAEELNLIATGGSDYHGTAKPDVDLGKVTVSDETVLQLKKAALR